MQLIQCRCVQLQRQPLRPKSRGSLTILFCVVSFAVSNVRVKLNVEEPKGTAVVPNRSTTTTANVINVASSAILYNDSIGSFFDCDRSGAKCRYFYPGAFYRHYFASTVKHNGGVNRTGVSTTSEQERLIQWRKKIGLWNGNLPALDSLSWWTRGGEEALSNYSIAATANSTNLEESLPNLNLPHNITYIHLQKCGGSSIQHAMYERARQIRKTRIRHDEEDELLHYLQADVHAYKNLPEKKPGWAKKRLGHIRAILSAQQSRSFPPPTGRFPIFTVVRDPIQRFLSAIQQVMHYNTEFREKCLREPRTPSYDEERARHHRRQTIQCAIEDVEKTSYRKDVHLLPMASHFRLLDGVNSADDLRKSGRDIAVSVFSMEDIRDVLRYLGNDDSSKSAIHARDRSNVEYATSPILAKLSSTDCSVEMIHRICSLYDVDVKLMKWLGFGGEAVERCK